MRVPRPNPRLVAEESEVLMAPAPELMEWARHAFLSPLSEIQNEAHQHLEDAVIDFCWALVPMKSQGRHILGNAKLGQPTGKPWPRSMQEQQLQDWFGRIPDFLITIDGLWASEEGTTDLQLAAVIDHELYHCSYCRDENGDPIVSQDTGLPQWWIMGHDVEEFVGVVERWGAWNPGLQKMKRALNREPLFGEIDIPGGCGVCLK